jgi:hypothetical protein
MNALVEQAGKTLVRDAGEYLSAGQRKTNKEMRNAFKNGARSVAANGILAANPSSYK